jgi:bacillithiol biosynthesis cysteine-adding enzyme BshC
MTDLLIVTEPLGGSPLAAAAVAGTTPAGWYLPRPENAAGWRARAEAARPADASWAARLEPAFGGLPDRLARTVAAGGVVVTTGQQPGLFGGPVYTWSKAISALALADALERATGVPTAPVFWAATDDADFAEASVTRVAVPGGVDTLRMPSPGVEAVPMDRVPLGDVRDLLARLRAGAGSAAYEAPLAAAERAYGDRGATVGGAYVQLLRALLGPLGIAVLDAAHPAVRAAGAPLLRRALREAPAVSAALGARERELAAAGYAPQVAAVAGLSLVFQAAPDGGKARVAEASAARAAESAADEALSPNVLLRPVMERAMLPTVAYVAGPGELAYFAQVSAVALALGATPPLAAPRWSGTVLEPHLRRLLARLELDAGALRDPHAAEGRLARAAMPPALAAALAAAREAVARSAAEIAAAAGGDAVPASVVRGWEAGGRTRVDRLERRYLAAVKRREQALMRDVATARGALWPGGVRQERALNLLPMLARQGAPLLDGMRRCADVAMGALVGGDAPDA